MLAKNLGLVKLKTNSSYLYKSKTLISTCNSNNPKKHQAPKITSKIGIKLSNIK